MKTTVIFFGLFSGCMLKQTALLPPTHGPTPGANAPSNGDTPASNPPAPAAPSSDGGAPNGASPAAPGSPTAAIVASPLSPSVVTGSTVALSIQLASAPTEDTTLALGSSDANRLSVNPASLTFTSGNFSIAQTVWLTAPNAATLSRDTIDLTISGPGLDDVIVPVNVESSAIAPEILWTLPAANAKQVVPNGSLAIAFSKPVTESEHFSIQVDSQSATLTLGTPVWNSTNDQVTIPTSGMALGKTYLLDISGTDFSTRLPFQTAATLDTTPVTGAILGAYYQEAAAATFAVTVSFSREVQKNSVVVQATNDSAAPNVGAPEWSFQADGTETATYAVGSLKGDSSYVFAVTAAKDLSSHDVSLTAQQHIYISTPYPPEYTESPVGTSVTQSTSVLQFTFTAPMDPSAAAAALDPNTNPIALQNPIWSDSNMTVSYAIGPFEYGSVHCYSFSDADLFGQQRTGSNCFIIEQAPSVTVTCTYDNTGSVGPILTGTIVVSAPVGSVYVGNASTTRVSSTQYTFAFPNLNPSTSYGPYAVSTQALSVVGGCPEFTTGPQAAVIGFDEFTDFNKTTWVVAKDSGVALTFSAPMVRASVEAAFGIGCNQQWLTNTYTWNDDSTICTATPTTGLPANAACVWSINPYGPIGADGFALVTQATSQSNFSDTFTVAP